MRSPRTAMKSSLHSLQLEKARVQQQRPNTAKNQSIKKKFANDIFTIHLSRQFQSSFDYNSLQDFTLLTISSLKVSLLWVSMTPWFHGSLTTFLFLLILLLGFPLSACLQYQAFLGLSPSSFSLLYKLSLRNVIHSQHLLSAQDVGTVLSILYALSDLIITICIKCRYYYSHFTGEKQKLREFE